MRTGLGLRPELFSAIERELPALDFLEAHSENYFGRSINRARLNDFRRHYPISLHGVGLSLGRADELDQAHLQNLKELVDEIEPMLVSEHLAWSAFAHRHLPDLLPLPLTAQSLSIICAHIEQLQEVLQRQILIENPSNYLLFDRLQIPEPEFLNTLAVRTGCGVLLDVNNVYVSSSNLQRDAGEYIQQLDSNVICQYHLAGYTEVDRHGEQLLIDTHNQTVFAPVWELFKSTVQQHGGRPTLVEWDSDFPELAILLGECHKADRILAKSTAIKVRSTAPGVAAGAATELQPQAGQPASLTALAMTQEQLLDQVLELDDGLNPAVAAHRHRIWVYQNNVFATMREYLGQVYPAVMGVVGGQFFKQMSQACVQMHPPAAGNIHLYGKVFADTVDCFESLRELPYLRDLISYEWALHQAYFSSLLDAVEPHNFAQDQLLAMPISLNSSACLIDSEYPVLEIHRQSLPSYHGEVAIDLAAGGDCLLVCKQGHSVSTSRLSSDQSIFIKALRGSENLLQAIDSLHGSVSDESLSNAMALVFQLRLLARQNSSQLT